MSNHNTVYFLPIILLFVIIPIMSLYLLVLSLHCLLYRLEIIEACSLALLNLMEWTYLSSFPMVQRCASTQLCASLAVSCIEMEKFKGNKKFSRELWDLIVPIFKRKPNNYKWVILALLASCIAGLFRLVARVMENHGARGGSLVLGSSFTVVTYIH